MTNVSVVVFVAAACTFGAVIFVVMFAAFAEAVPLNSAAAIVKNNAAKSVALPRLSLLMAFVFMMFSFGFGWWFVFRLLM
jgi:hypothetical protein